MIPTNLRPWAAAVIALIGSFVPWGTLTTEVSMDTNFGGLGSIGFGMRHVEVLLTGWNGSAMHVPNWVPVLLLLIGNGALAVGASRAIAAGAAILGMIQVSALAVIVGTSTTGTVGPGVGVMLASGALTLYAAKRSDLPGSTESVA